MSHFEKIQCGIKDPSILLLVLLENCLFASYYPGKVIVQGYYKDQPYTVENAVVVRAPFVPTRKYHCHIHGEPRTRNADIAWVFSKKDRSFILWLDTYEEGIVGVDCNWLDDLYRSYIKKTLEMQGLIISVENDGNFVVKNKSIKFISGLVNIAIGSKKYSCHDLPKTFLNINS